MILHYPGRRAPLTEYGILIPVAPGKTGKVLDALRTHPVLGPRESEWLLGPDGSTITREDLLRVNSPQYVARLFSEELERVIVQVYELVDDAGRYHRYDPSRATRPLTELFDGTLRNVAGTYQCGKEALERGFCYYLGGGAHHGHREFGHGFCVLNDSVIALRKLQAEDRIKTAWVIDVDAHKGDGTAALTAGDPSIITLSVHMARGWPLDEPEVYADGRPNPAYTPSDIDVPIESGQEAEYLPRLEAALAELGGRPLPDIAYVLAGADPYEKDELPSTQLLRLTLEQMNRRDRMIYDFLKGKGVPQAFLTAGGYGAHAWEVYPPFMEHVLLDRLGG